MPTQHAESRVRSRYVRIPHHTMMLLILLAMAGVARSSSVAFANTIDQLQQCQGLGVLAEHALEGCTTSIDSSFNALAAAYMGRPISQVERSFVSLCTTTSWYSYCNPPAPTTQDMASALVRACTSRQTPRRCMADLVLTAAASTGPQMQNQDTDALLTALDAMCMGNAEQPCFLEAAHALESVNWG